MLTYSALSSRFAQGDTKVAIQFFAYYLRYIKGGEPSLGTWLEHAYRLMVTNAESPLYIKTGYNMMIYTSPSADNMPVFACGIVRPKKTYTLDKLTEAVALFPTPGQQALVAVALSGVLRMSIARVSMLKCVDYDPSEGVLLGHKLPEWVNRLVSPVYVKSIHDEKEWLFGQKNMISAVNTSIHRIREKYGVNVYRMLRERMHWVPIREDQLYIV